MPTKTSLLLAFCFVLLVCAQSWAEGPPFRNSIVSTNFDFITANDPNAFVSLRFIGQSRKEMPDKRSDDLFCDDTFVFETRFNDSSKIQIWVHKSFDKKEVAERYAKMLTGPLGKLPKIMRGKVDHVVIHNGDETAFGESEGHFFVLYSKNMETRSRNHDLEETVFHESVHASLDSKYGQSKAWLAAQRADGSFITEYAANKPNREDMAESALFAYTIIKHPGRLPAEVERSIRNRMPTRLAFFQKLFAETVTESD